MKHLHDAPRSVCIVAGSDDGHTGTAITTLADYRRGGWRTHVLATTATSTDLAASADHVHCVDDTTLPTGFRVPNLYQPAAIDRGDAIRFALERLHREYQFDRIEFPALGGTGFRSVQAKRAGLAFADVSLAVRLDECAARRRERARRWPDGFEAVEGEFAERYAFEHADEQIIPDADTLAFVRGKGWGVMPAAVEKPPGRPLVSIGIAYHNLGRYLPATLTTLETQTYPDLDVIVIDDGSTDPESHSVFDAMTARYPNWRFLRQPNAGIGATRNRCLELARGELFIPVDADNLTRPDMVERLVCGMERNPDLAAMTCYHLAFEGDGDQPCDFLYACRPTGGPHVLSAIRNVYGDANAVFRTDVLRGIGGYETDRGTSNEDWELFVKLVHTGGRIGVVPDHLFYYRHRPGGFSRTTNWFANHQRVLRQFTRGGPLSPDDAEVLWTALLGFHQEIERLKGGSGCRRHRVADAVYAAIRSVGRVVRRKRVTSRRPSS